MMLVILIISVLFWYYIWDVMRFLPLKLDKKSWAHPHVYVEI